MTVKELLNRLGGVVAVSKLMDLPISTVSGWSINNRIPKRRRPEIERIAKRLSVEVPETFAEPVA